MMVTLESWREVERSGPRNRQGKVACWVAAPLIALGMCSSWYGGVGGSEHVVR